MNDVLIALAIGFVIMCCTVFVAVTVAMQKWKKRRKETYQAYVEKRKGGV